MKKRGHRLTRRRLLTGVGAGLTASLVGTSSSTAQTEGSGEQLSFGETFVAPNDTAITVDRLELNDSYEWGSSGSTYTEDAPEGMQFAWVYLAAENRANQPQQLPFDLNIYLRSGNQQFEPKYPMTSEGQYTSIQAGPGVVQEGWIHYQVPADLSESDLNVVWYGDNGINQWTATWSGTASTGTSTSTTTSG